MSGLARKKIRSSAEASTSAASGSPSVPVYDRLDARSSAVRTLRHCTISVMTVRCTSPIRASAQWSGVDAVKKGPAQPPQTLALSAACARVLRRRLIGWGAPLPSERPTHVGQSRIALTWSPQSREPSPWTVHIWTLIRSMPPTKLGSPMVKW